MVHFPARQEGLSYKLLAHWDGPYKVVDKIDSVTYRIRIEKEKKVQLRPVHVQLLKLYKPWKEII